MAGLFENVSINGMTLANRFVRSAAWEELATHDGSVTPKLTEMMVELARSEVGLIISGYTFVSPEGQSSPGQLAIHADRFVAGLRGMVQPVREADGKMALQIIHAGRFAESGLTGSKLVPSTRPCRITCKRLRGRVI